MRPAWDADPLFDEEVCDHAEKTAADFCLACGEYLGMRRRFVDVHGEQKSDPAYFDNAPDAREIFARIASEPYDSSRPPPSPVGCALNDDWPAVDLALQTIGAEQDDETDALEWDFDFRVWRGIQPRGREGRRRWTV